MAEIKRCSKCGIDKSLDSFSKSKTHRDGVNSWCKDCYKSYCFDNKNRLKEYHKEYNNLNKNKITKCRAVNKEIHREQTRKWKEANKARISEYGKKHYEDNREDVLEYNRKYNNDNKARLAAISKKWRKDNKDYISKYNKAYDANNKDRIAKKRANNPAPDRVRCQRRRALKRELPSTLTAQQWEAIKLHFNNKCAYCGKEAKLQQEHFIPIKNNGEYTHNNIVPSCGKCNMSKHTLSFFEWYPQYSHYSKRREAKILKFLNYKDGVQQLSLDAGISASKTIKKLEGK